MLSTIEYAVFGSDVLETVIARTLAEMSTDTATARAGAIEQELCKIKTGGPGVSQRHLAVIAQETGIREPVLSPFSHDKARRES